MFNLRIHTLMVLVVLLSLTLIFLAAIHSVERRSAGGMENVGRLRKFFLFKPSTPKIHLFQGNNYIGPGDEISLLDTSKIHFIANKTGNSFKGSVSVRFIQGRFSKSDIDFQNTAGIRIQDLLALFNINNNTAVKGKLSFELDNTDLSINHPDSIFIVGMAR
jgi:hypothetical protein